MPEVSRLGDSFATGHACTGSSTIGQASGNVFAAGIGVARQGDMSATHTFLVADECVPHAVPISGGSGSVFANGRPVARIGDGIDAGAITGGAGSVYAGG